MEFAEYKSLIKESPLGKKLPDALYLHESALDVLPIKMVDFLNLTLSSLELQKLSWNVIKLFKNDFKLSLLLYPNFFEDPYPALETSYTIDLNRKTYRKADYSTSNNPPILHRKETFLKPTHPAYKDFCRITEEAEAAGLYENTRLIGFRQTWEKLIARKGYHLDGCSLIINTCNLLTNRQSIPAKIQRHLTAIDRKSLSSPMQSLYHHDYLDGQFTVLDFGCGKGDDIRILCEHGVDAIGWDPVYNKNSDFKEKDIVNLGFVINVIENIQERNEVLQKAFQYATKLLVISAMLGGESIVSRFNRWGDGVITERDTFQKYYSQRELKEYIESVLKESPVAVGPGIFYVYKDKVEEQNFLVNREKVRRNWIKISSNIHPEKLKIRQLALYELHKELFDDFWITCLDLGRIPVNQEFDHSERLRAITGSHKKAFILMISLHDQSIIDKAFQVRQSDLTVYFALEHFGRRNPYYVMPDSLKRDIKVFFQTYKHARETGKALLFSLGKPETIHKACEDWYSEYKIGVYEEGHSLILHKSLLDQLPATLRTYIGCARQLYGNFDEVDLIKVHIRSGKVSLMQYDDFDNKSIPLLIKRIKIKLRQQDVDIFEYGADYAPHPLYFKSKYLPTAHVNYQKQVLFDQKMAKLPFDFSGYGPSLEELTTRIKGWNL